MSKILDYIILLFKSIFKPNLNIIYITSFIFFENISFQYFEMPSKISDDLSKNKMFF